MKKTILVGLLALIIAPETLGATTISKSKAYSLCKQKVINEQNASRVKSVSYTQLTLPKTP